MIEGAGTGLAPAFTGGTMKSGLAFTFLALFGAVAWAAEAPTDPQIAAIVVTANQVDIDAGQLAESKTKNAQVREFAQLMVKDHTGVNQAATELVNRLKVTPETNPTSDSLKQGGDQNLASLRKLKGSAFDKAYVDH